MLVQAATVSFDSINVGDQLPTMQKSETQQDIDNYLILNQRPEREIEGMNLHIDSEFAEQGIFGSMVNYGVSTCGFMVELLQTAFPTRNVTQGSISMRAMEPIQANDVITYTGEVIDKREEEGKRLVDVEVRGVNQMGQTVAVAKASVPL